MDVASLTKCLEERGLKAQSLDILAHLATRVAREIRQNTAVIGDSCQESNK